MGNQKFRVAVIRGDGIGVDVTDATLAVVDAAQARVGGFELEYESLLAGAGYFAENGVDVAPGTEEAARQRMPYSWVRSACRRFVTPTEPKFLRIYACAKSSNSTRVSGL